MISILIIASLALTACGGSGTTTSTAPTPEAVAAYCAAVNTAPTVGFDEALHLLDEVALPGVADLMTRLLNNEWSQEAFFELGDFNETTCNLRWP